jgi:endonuclease YncB( thermonuclease family)
MHMFTSHNLMRLAVATAVLLSSVAAAEPVKVIHVADGDTVTVLTAAKTERRVRLAAIDAPEVAHRSESSGRTSQPYGDASRRALREVANGQQADLDCRNTDRFGRGVCVLRIDGRDVGEQQIRVGLAWHFTRFAAEQPPAERAAYAAAEREARAARRGLWRDADPVPPWDWRKTNAR